MNIGGYADVIDQVLVRQPKCPTCGAQGEGHYMGYPCVREYLSLPPRETSSSKEAA